MAPVLIFIVLALVAKEINAQEMCLATQAIDDFKLLIDLVNNQTTQNERQRLYHERYQIFIKKLRECPKLIYKPGSLDAMKLLDVVWGTLMIRGQVIGQCMGSITSYTISLLSQSITHIVYEGLYSIVHVLIFGLGINFHIEGFENKFDTTITNSCIAINDGIGAILAPTKEYEIAHIDTSNTNMPIKYALNNEDLNKLSESGKAVPGFVYILPNTILPHQDHIPVSSLKTGIKSKPDAVADNIANMISVMDKTVPVLNNANTISEVTPGVTLNNLKSISTIRSGAPLEQSAILDTIQDNAIENSTLLESIPVEDLNNLQNLHPSLNLTELNTNSTLDNDTVEKIKELAQETANQNATAKIEEKEAPKGIAAPWWKSFWKLFG